jgi:hypothetical protein
MKPDPASCSRQAMGAKLRNTRPAIRVEKGLASENQLLGDCPRDWLVAKIAAYTVGCSLMFKFKLVKKHITKLAELMTLYFEALAYHLDAKE